MPAKYLHRTDVEGAYSHIYSKGVEGKLIFNNEEDYNVFLDCLKDYLSPPRDSESLKKVFTVRGKTFRGKPYQLKNYFNKIELISYCLLPDHFHLLLYQITKGSIEKFIRSLCTKYSAYFNKKYQHTGPVFIGPYKSVSVEPGLQLSHLTRYLHSLGNHSSYPEYVSVKETSWIKPNTILSLFQGVDGYKEFMEKYGRDPKEKELIDRITFEHETNILTSLKGEFPEGNEYVQPDSGVELQYPDTELRYRTPAFLAICILSALVFTLLTIVGIRNIKASAHQESPTLSTPVIEEQK